MPMTATPTRRPPAFFWQGVLIMLPVAVLAMLSLMSLRQDEQAAENDARSRAAANVQGLARAMRASADEELQRFLTLQNVWMIGLRLVGQPSVSLVFPDARLQTDMEKWERDYPGLNLTSLAMPQGEILADGRQIEPPDFPAAPTPPKWFREFSLEQRELWEALHTAGSPNDIEARRNAFMQSNPSTDAQQAAIYLSTPAEQLISHSTALPSETGISFEEIACYRLLSTTNARLTDSLLQSVWWQLFEHPSIVSPRLLELVGGLTNRATTAVQRKFFWMQTYFTGRSKTSGALDSLRQLPELQPWKMSWWSHWTADDSALAIFQPTTYVNPGNDFEGVSLAGHGYEIWLVPRAIVEAIFNRALADNKFLVPDYAATRVTIEDVKLTRAGETAAVDEKSLLGEAEQKAGSYFAQNAIRFDVKFYLTDREQMLSAERRRAKLFGALILGAALTAFLGLLAARRAFRRQLQLNEMKSNFVSSVSHELRAPIASVRLMAENLAGGTVAEPQKQSAYFSFILQECRRLSSLIENVLDFSRIEQGRKQYEFEPTDALALVRETVKLMEPRAAEKGVTLELGTSNLQRPTSNIEWIMDGRAIQQALVNLIDNAIKHSPKGETVSVGLECGARSAECGVETTLNPQLSTLNLSVTDHGPGIPREEHKRIFERFYRRGSELRRETQGVGIGLSIVKHVVTAHGGRVLVDSQPGQGSRFTIELPVQQQHE